MKKLIALFVVMVLAFAAIGLVACDKEPVVETKYAYGIVHHSYVGRGMVEFTDGAVTDAELEEAVLPTTSYASFTEANYNADKDNMTAFATTSHGSAVTYYLYNTLKFGDNTLTLGDAGYTVKVNGTDTDFLTALKADAKLCEAYFEAAANGKLIATASSGDLVLDSTKILKSTNGYWSVAGGMDKDYWLGYSANTSKWFVENYEEAEYLYKDAETKNFVDDNGVSTGATWVDMADYVGLLYKAAGLDTIAVGTVYTGSMTYNAWETDYGATVDVVVADGKIIDVKLYADKDSGYVMVSESWDKKATWIDGAEEYVNSFVGMTVTEVNALTAIIKDVDGATDDKIEGIDYVTGATQSSSRVILAIQDALAEIGA